MLAFCRVRRETAQRRIGATRPTSMLDARYPIASASRRSTCGLLQVGGEEPPPLVAKLAGPIRRSNDVGEDDRLEAPFRRSAPAYAGEEFLDLLDDGVGVLLPDVMVRARQFDESGARDYPRCISRLLGIQPC